LLAEVMSSRVCVLAGSHEYDDVLPPATYRRAIGDLAASGVPTVADLSDHELLSALDGGVHLLKISDEELAAAGEGSDAFASARKLRARGASNVVVSLGAAGSIALVDDTWLRVSGPQLEIADSRGSGDSMTAGLAVGVAQGLDWPEALRLASAAGAVNATRHGSGSGRLDTITQLAARFEVERLDEEVAA
jgi:1-phosphofructokinase